MTIAFHGIKNCQISAENVQELKAQKENYVTSGTFESFDVFQTTQKSKPQPQDEVVGAAPKIGMARILFKRLTQEQIYGVNTSGELPENAKFKEDINGKPSLTWNIADFTAGTHKLPKGYELKNDILGFTHVVREGTKSWYLKENKTAEELVKK